MSSELPRRLHLSNGGNATLSWEQVLWSLVGTTFRERRTASTGRNPNGYSFHLGGPLSSASHLATPTHGRLETAN